MKRWMTGIAMVGLAACVEVMPVQRPAGTPAGTRTGGNGGAPQAPAAAADTRAAVQEMIGLVNAHRRAARCPELAWLPAAANAAQGHSDDMARRDYFDHSSPEGLGPDDRLRAHGVAYRALAENIAMHPGAPRQVLAGWVASAGHRRNLETCMYTHHGIGVRNGYWTHLFVTPAPAAASP